MAVLSKTKRLLRDKKGDEAVSFLLTTAMLVLIFATLVSCMIYVMQYYNASYVCRRVVRNIEIAGEYIEADAMSVINQLQNDDLEDITLIVDATYVSGRKIQLRESFNAILTAIFKIKILQIGKTPIEISLPIEVKIRGMSEVYWRE